MLKFSLYLPNISWSNVFGKFVLIVMHLVYLEKQGASKGQIISKLLLVSSNSPKNEETNSFILHTTTNSFIHFFGRIGGHQKVLSKLSELYKGNSK